MRICYINDCTGFVNVAPCCLDCPEREACPDRCSMEHDTYCAAVMDEADSGVKEEVKHGCQQDEC